jgi:hypothetical protein
MSESIDLPIKRVSHWLRTWLLSNGGEIERFDVFLCYNSDDKSAVRWVAERLRERGIRAWLDEAELRPGRGWQDEVERQIGAIRAAAVLIGSNGLGPWQNREVRALLQQFVERGCPVIPVLLPDAVMPTLPLFLHDVTWVDLRTNDPAEMDRLAWGITGRKLRRRTGGAGIRST